MAASVSRSVRSGNNDVDALLTDYRWGSTFHTPTIYYAFPTKTNGTWTGYSSGGESPEPYEGFRAFANPQKSIVIGILDSLESLTGLDFFNTDLFNWDHSEADLRFGFTDATETAHAYTPDDDPRAGDVWFNNSFHEYDSAVRGDYAYFTYLHEIGHALGLKHPHDNENFGIMSLAHDNMNYTVMSYRSYYNMDLEAGYPNGDYGFPQTYMMYDVAALQHLYGADYGTNGNNTVYRWTPANGQTIVDNGVFLSPGGNTIFMTVWDGGGIDTYDLSAYNNALLVDLAPGAWTRTSYDQLADLGDNHDADGNIANALLYKGDLRSLIENAIGGSGDDQMMGNQGSNILTGNAGNDWLDGRTGADTLIGGSGDDRYFVDNSGDSIIEDPGAGLDSVEVSAATFTLGANVETMTGVATAFAQTLTGSATNDRIIGNNVNGNRLDGAGGDDNVIGGSGNDHIIGGTGNDVLGGSEGADLFEGGEGNDSVQAGSGNDTVHGGSGDDFASGSAGVDTLRGDSGADVLDGGGEDDSLYGGDDADVLYGQEGNDRIEGGAGADQIDTGSGADRIIYLAATDSTEAAQDRIRAFESGTDKIDLTAIEVYTVEWTQLTDPANGSVYNLVTVQTTGGTMRIRVDGQALALSDFLLPAGPPPIVGTEGDDTLGGTSNVDTILGNGGNDTLNGLDQNDRLEGGAGNDRLDGGLGGDILRGGIGDDVYVVDSGSDTVTELAGEGNDEVQTALASYTLAANVEKLTGLGSGGQTLTGNDSANFIDGGLGADLMSGGLGDDIFLVDNVGDQAIEAASAGNDEVRTGLAAFTLGANVERLTGTSASGQTLTGNGLANIMTGGTGNDVIDGGAGADTMAGGLGDDIFHADNGGDVVIEAASAGNDEVRTALSSYSIAGVGNVEKLTGTGSVNQTLTGNGSANIIDGGLGADVMIGGFGNDLYLVDNVGDQAVENANDGIDEVRTALAAYTIGANVELLTGTSGAGQTLTGNAIENIIAGGAGNDIIDGGLAGDTMTGGLGNDVYFVDNLNDIVTELAGQGSDEVRTGLAVYTLGSGADVELLTGTSALGQTLTGNGLANTIRGGAGNDMLDGAAGSDSLFGGLGNDIYLLNAGDTISEGEEQGIDEVRTSLSSFSLAPFANVENLTGGSGDQTLTGNGWNNLIDGGAGADSMAGGGGHDVYIVDNAGDTVTELDSAGMDEVRTSLGSKAAPAYALYVLPDNVENLTGTSAGAQGVRGNALGNVINMGAGADLIVLDNGGIDSVNGGGGNDFIYYGATLTIDDTTNGGAGTDTLGLLGNYASGITFTAANLVGVERLALYTGGGGFSYTVTTNDANVLAGGELFVTAASLTATEILTFNGSAETDGRLTVIGGSAGDTIIGGGSSDYIAGNAGNDVINGMNGVDFLIGGAGADQLTGGAGVDHFRYLGTADSMTGNIDHILDFQHIDRIDLTAIDANGNAGDGNNAFTFIGSNAFGNVAGQLRATQSGGVWTVEGDTNGDGLADLILQVTVADATPLGAADFML